MDRIELKLSEHTTRSHPILRDTTNLNTVNLGITTYCSMRCPNCSVKSPQLMKEKRAVTETWEDIQTAGAMMRPMRRVHVTGGEPTLHPKFDVIANNVKEWFEAQYVTLESNGFAYERWRNYIIRHFDLVFITNYAKDAIYPGSPDNADVIKRAQDDLGDRLIVEEPVTHARCHKEIKEPLPLWTDQSGHMFQVIEARACSKWVDPGLPAAYYNGQLYACCVSSGIDESLSIPLTENWRVKIQNLNKGCKYCVYYGS